MEDFRKEQKEALEVLLEINERGHTNWQVCQ